jgi:hypothetical protein
MPESDLFTPQGCIFRRWTSEAIRGVLPRPVSRWQVIRCLTDDRPALSGPQHGTLTRLPRLVGSETIGLTLRAHRFDTLNSITDADWLHYNGVTKAGHLVVARGLAERTKGTRVTVTRFTSLAY